MSQGIAVTIGAESGNVARWLLVALFLDSTAPLMPHRFQPCPSCNHMGDPLGDAVR